MSVANFEGTVTILVTFWSIKKIVALFNLHGSLMKSKFLSRELQGLLDLDINYEKTIVIIIVDHVIQYFIFRCTSMIASLILNIPSHQTVLISGKESSNKFSSAFWPPQCDNFNSIFFNPKSKNQFLTFNDVTILISKTFPKNP